jgi:hypothetical protein
MGARGVVERDADRVVVRLRGDSSCAMCVLEVCGLGDLLVAGPVDAAPVSTTQGALGTWVAVPATDRGDRDSHAPKPTPGSALNVVRRGRA